MACADNPYMGSIDLWSLPWAPANWMLCQGQQLAVNQYQAVFSLIGTTYGGNGQTYFNLPDLRGRVAMGAQNPAIVGPTGIGQTGGAQAVTLTINNLPAHNHPATLGQAAQFSGSISIQVKTGLGAGTGNPQGAYLGPGANIYFSSPTQGSALGPAPIVLTAGSGAPVTVGLTGGNVPVETLPPYLTLNYIICVVGIYPVRP